VVYPEGSSYIESFQPEPWPKWVYRLPGGSGIEQEIFVKKGAPLAVISWKLLSGEKARLFVRPFISGRDYHAMHHENGGFRFDAKVEGNRVIFYPYDHLPSIASISNAAYRHAPEWYRNFRYDEEFARGFEETEDLGSPGVLEFDLGKPAIWFLTTDPSLVGNPVEQSYQQIRDAEMARRTKFPTRLHKSADSYIVKRGQGQTIIAGYPWFTDWGRDTFISLRGLCIAGGRLDEAEQILTEWSGQVSQGMLPNLFVDKGGVPEFNSVDASLWYVIAVYDFLKAAEIGDRPVSAEVRGKLRGAVEAILEGFSQGTRYHIKADADGLLMAGEPGVQLTWMDAKVGDYVVTPRTGKPVEIQALWLGALKIGSAWNDHWNHLYQQGIKAFAERFWNEGGYLYDVVDVDHVPGKVDASFRPNQILAVGGLPFAILGGERAKAVVEAVEERLLTPLGPRSLAPGDPAYRPHYGGNVYQRDTAYHQGTVWPWLMGPFVEAWVRVRGDTLAAKQEARERFLKPLLEHLEQAGLGHISEIANGDTPYKPNGCPFQAWSVGEALRLDQVVLKVGTQGFAPFDPKIQETLPTPL
jgi:predicted glycogen debranching enzyme